MNIKKNNNEVNDLLNQHIGINALANQYINTSTNLHIN